MRAVISVGIANELKGIDKKEYCVNLLSENHAAPFKGVALKFVDNNKSYETW